jgi:hypothetical protein
MGIRLLYERSMNIIVQSMDLSYRWIKYNRSYLETREKDLIAYGNVRILRRSYLETERIHFLRLEEALLDC